MPSLSVIILTKNEESNIIDCLDSVSFAEEVIVIDDESSDRTLELIRIYKEARIKILKRKLDDFSSQRNYGISKSTGEWILFIDADERVSKELQNEIQRILKNKSNMAVGYFIKREDVMWSKRLKYGETGTMYILRLAKRNAGLWEGKVHEIWNINGLTRRLTGILSHYPHKQINIFLREINSYTSFRADELFSNRIKVSWMNIATYPVAKFASNYILKMGFLDGIEGFIFAVLMSLHSFLVRGKLWWLWRK